MAGWRKTLRRMVNDPSPTGYTYDEAATVLSKLGFTLAPSSGGSHRKWRLDLSNGVIVRVGLVERGSGTMKAYLVRDMLDRLREHDLIPPDLE